MPTTGMQISLFPEAKQLEGHLEGEVSQSVAPRWVFGRIDKKKGRHLWVLKQHRDAAIVCISHLTVQQYTVPLPGIEI